VHNSTGKSRGPEELRLGIAISQEKFWVVLISFFYFTVTIVLSAF